MSSTVAAAQPPSPITATSSPAAASSSLPHQFLPTIIIILLIVLAVILILYVRRIRPDGATAPPSTASPSSIRHSLPSDGSSSSLRRASTAAGDGHCAVCLSKLDRRDRKLLPACCHAFHPNCIDTWLLDNRTCPVCRSDAIEASDSDAASLLHRDAEIGSVSNSRRRHAVSARSEDAQRINYSGSFNFAVDDEQPDMIGNRSAAEISERSWLQDYLVSRVQSFRTAFTGSSRWSQVADLEETEA